MARPWPAVPPMAALLLLALAALALPVGARAAPPLDEPVLAADEWSAIRQVIGDQVSALKSGDGSRAFSYASPGIRLEFGTPENFLAMVRTNYDALIAARYTEFLDGAVIDDRVIQPLRLIAPDNSVLVALYTMEKQNDGSWRIAGCVLAPSTVQAA